MTPTVSAAETIGQQIQYSAQVLDQSGTPISRAPVTWSSASESVAAVSATGLATVTGQGNTSIRARHETVSGTASLTVKLKPAELAKVAGDDQTAPALTLLPENPAVRATDAGGSPCPRAPSSPSRSFPGGGQIAPRNATTDASGEAFTRWTLGEVTGVQVLRATAGSLQADFTVVATDPPLMIRGRTLNRARIAVPYLAQFEATGGTAPLSWSVLEGELPPGLEIGEATGLLAGTATAMSSGTFTIRVEDAAGSTAVREFSLRVCDAPLNLDAGEVLASDPASGADSCPPFLPAGQAGDRYRVAVVRTSTSTAQAPAGLRVRVREADGAGDEAPAKVSQGRYHEYAGLRLAPEWAASLHQADATARFHSRMHAEAEELLRQLGRDALLPDGGERKTAGQAGRADGSADPPENRILIMPYKSDQPAQACQLPSPAPAPALLAGYNDYVAVYQDSAQRAGDPADTADVRRVLDYYDAYGARTINEYFDGVSDINNDGRVTAYISPIEDGIAAFVWAGDFFSRDECAGSNEQELLYIGVDMFHAVSREDNRHYQAMPTLVHEVKHISSLYKRLRAEDFHPSWIEEGSAEIAGEVSSRMAMEAVGGVSLGARLARDAYPPRIGPITSPENYGVLLRLLRTLLSYSASPVNSLTSNPNSEYHTYYGTSCTSTGSWVMPTAMPPTGATVRSSEP